MNKWMDAKTKTPFYNSKIQNDPKYNSKHKILNDAREEKTKTCYRGRSDCFTSKNEVNHKGITISDNVNMIANYII